MTRHGYTYRPDICPEHEFGSNDGQPVDDHCSRCGIHWSQRGAPAARGSDVRRCDRCGNPFPVWGTRNVAVCNDCERNIRSASEQGDRMAQQIASVFDRERATRELIASLRATLAGVASCSTCEVCREAARSAHALAEAWQ